MQELPTISDNCCRSCGGRIRAGIIQAFVQWNVGRCVLIVWQGWVRAFCARLGRTSIARGHRWSVAGCALLMCTSKTLHNMRTHTHACTHAHHTHVHTYTHKCANTQTCTHTHMHARTHAHAHMHAHTHTRTHTYTQMHTHTHTHMRMRAPGAQAALLHQRHGLQGSDPRGLQCGGGREGSHLAARHVRVSSLACHTHTCTCAHPRTHTRTSLP